MTKEKQNPVYEYNETLDGNKSLILFNDDFNTFDHVIESLVDVCKHDQIQAEQCAFIVHYKGKCIVKTDAFTILKPMFDELSRRDLTVSID
ncbi:MAG: ATP-dependent Clp protease adaptor ClpS [Bacteroidales bacterium]|nr:ATP-dependent Clp protease adaptor ClpS [Bacteroidales bacterium]